MASVEAPMMKSGEGMNVEAVKVVAGFGRCGTSLVMQMLEAAGVPTTGEFPAFEPPETNLVNFDPKWVARQQGKAVKLIVVWSEFREVRWPDVPCRILWLDRDRDEQAKSMVKMNTTFFGPMMDGGHEGIAKALRRDRPHTLRKLAMLGDVATLRFEDLLRSPFGAAQVIAGHFGVPDDKLDAMVRCVLRRGDACRPDMMIEVELIQRREQAVRGRPF